MTALPVGDGWKSVVNPASRTIFGREPAFWVGAVQACLIFFVSFGLDLTTDQVGALVAITNAVLGVVLAVLVRPINVAVFNSLGQAVITIVVSFGLGFTPEQIGAISGLLGLVLSYMAVRPQVVPVATLKSGQIDTQPNLPAGV